MGKKKKHEFIGMPRPLLTGLERVFPAILAACLTTVMSTSKVALEGSIFPLWAFESITYIYIGLLFFIVFRPYKELHIIAGPLGVFVLVTRGMAFVDLVLGGRYDLLGAVAERFTWALALLFYHRVMVTITRGWKDDA